MSSTAVVQLSEAEIKRQASTGVLTLRDPRYPGLRFRFTGDRTTGSWYLMTNRSWKKVAGYPQLPVKKLLEVLPELQAQRALGQPVAAASNRWSTCGELLEWYRERVSKDRSLTAKRKNGVCSMIDVQLLPRIADLSIDDVSRESIDRMLMWPLQESLSTSYVRSILRVLQMAFAQAERIDVIDSNPLAGLKFTDFVQAKIKPKAARLHMIDLRDLVERLVDCYQQRIELAMLAIMMLCHGTRVGETRKARWRHICLTQRVWVIPQENTKTRAEHVLPLTEQACSLLLAYRSEMERRGRDADALFTERMSGQIISEANVYTGFRWMSGGQWSSHDLRKLARTGWVEIGVDYLIGEMLLNHAVGFSAETYINTSAEDLKLDALNRWHARLDGAGLSAVWSGTEQR